MEDRKSPTIEEEQFREVGKIRENGSAGVSETCRSSRPQKFSIAYKAWAYEAEAKRWTDIVILSTIFDKTSCFLNES